MYDVAADAECRLVIEQDDTLLHVDRRQLFELTRRATTPDRIRYEHQRAHLDLALALPDVVAWCWVRSGDWRRRVDPILARVRQV